MNSRKFCEVQSGGYAFPKASWTIMVYVHADSNLGNNAVEDVKEMAKSHLYSKSGKTLWDSIQRVVHGLPVLPPPEFRTSDNDASRYAGIHLVLLIDRPASAHTTALPFVIKCFPRLHKTDELKYSPNTIEVYMTSPPGDSRGELALIKDHGELDMTARRTLRDFLGTNIRRLPAEKYGLILWNHGASWKGLGSDSTTMSGGFPLRRIVEAIQGGIYDASVKSGGMPTPTKLSFVGVDACLMSDYTVMQALSQYADTIIASEENEEASGWDWRYLHTSYKKGQKEMVAGGDRLALSIMQGYSRLRRSPNVTMAVVNGPTFLLMNRAFAEFLEFGTSCGHQLVPGLITRAVVRTSMVQSCRHVGICYCYDFGSFLLSLSEMILSSQLVEIQYSNVEIALKELLLKKISKVRNLFLKAVPYVLGDNQVFAPLEVLPAQGVSKMLQSFWYSSNDMAAMSGLSFYYPRIKPQIAPVSPFRRSFIWLQTPRGLRQLRTEDVPRQFGPAAVETDSDENRICADALSRLYIEDFSTVWSNIFKMMLMEPASHSVATKLSLKSARNCLKSQSRRLLGLGLPDQTAEKSDQICGPKGQLIPSTRLYLQYGMRNWIPKKKIICACDHNRGFQGDGWSCSTSPTLKAALLIPLFRANRDSRASDISAAVKCLLRSRLPPEFQSRMSLSAGNFITDSNGRFAAYRVLVEVKSVRTPAGPPLDLLFHSFSESHTLLGWHAPHIVQADNCSDHEDVLGYEMDTVFDYMRLWVVEKLIVDDGQWNLSPSLAVHLLTAPFPEFSGRIYKDGLAIVVVLFAATLFILAIHTARLFLKIGCDRFQSRKHL